MFREPCCESMRIVWELDREYLAHHETITSEARLEYHRKRHEVAKGCIHEKHTTECLKESDLDKKCYLSKEKEQHMEKCSFCRCYFEGILTDLRSRQFGWRLQYVLQDLFIYFMFGVYAPYLERKQI